MAIITITPVEQTDIAAELASRGYTQAAAMPPVHHHVIPPPVEPVPHQPIPPIPPPEPTPLPRHHTVPPPPRPHDIVEHHAPILHIPVADHHVPPLFHIPQEHHATPHLPGFPEIHIPAEALEPTGWRKYGNWLPLVVLLAREKDILDFRR